MCSFCCTASALTVTCVCVATPAAGTSTFLKIRWWVGTGLLATPMVAVQLWYASPAPSALLPPDALVHIFVAWAVGGLMAYLSDWYRRCVRSLQMGKRCCVLLFSAGGVPGAIACPC
jgi:hypothetical protein